MFESKKWSPPETVYSKTAIHISLKVFNVTIYGYVSLLLLQGIIKKSSDLFYLLLSKSVPLIDWSSFAKKIFLG